MVVGDWEIMCCTLLCSGCGLCVIVICEESRSAEEEGVVRLVIVCVVRRVGVCQVDCRKVKFLEVTN